MSDHQNNADEQLDEARTYTQAQIFELFNQWQLQTKQEQHKSFEESELPLDIKQILEDSTPLALRENLNRYKKQIHKYYHEDWTNGETTNKEFIPKLKNFTIDTYQVVNTIYKHADLTRIAARAATELYEQQLFLQNNHTNLTSDQANDLLEDIIQGTKKLAVYSWATAKGHDEEAKDLIFRAIRPPRVFNIWERQQSWAERKQCLTKNLSSNTMTPNSSNPLCEQQPFHQITHQEVEEINKTGQNPISEEMDIQILYDGVELEPHTSQTTTASSTTSIPTQTSQPHPTTTTTTTTTTTVLWYLKVAHTHKYTIKLWIDYSLTKIYSGVSILMKNHN